MDVVECRCLSCHALLLVCVNEWNQITNTYFTYSQAIQVTPSKDGLSLCPPNRLGSSQLEGCLLQPLRCEKCTTLIGARCIEAPEEKVQYSGHNFLKLANMRLESASAGVVVTPRIKEFLPFTASDINTTGIRPSTTSPKPIAARMLMQYPDGEGKSEQEPESLTTSTYGRHSLPKRPVPSSSLDTSKERPVDVADPMKELPAALWDIVGKQRQDIDRILRSVETLQNQMTEISSTIFKIQSVSKEILPVRHTPQEPPALKTNIPGADLYLLTEQISKIAEKSDEVDELRFELEAMKEIVKSLEEKNTAEGVQAVSNIPDRQSGLDSTARKSSRSSIRSSPLANLSCSAKSIKISKPPLTSTNRSLSQPKNFSTSSDTSSSDYESQIPAHDLNGPVNDIDPQRYAQKHEHQQQPSNLDLQQLPPQHDEVRKVLGNSDTKTYDRHDVALEELGPGEILDANTTPTADISNDNDSAKFIVLNSPDDTEDTDYHPRRHTPTSPRDRGGIRGRGRGRGRGSRVRKIRNPRLPTPEWEKPDWNGPGDLPNITGSTIHVTPISSRGRTIMRRGLSGGMAATSSASKRQRSSSPDFNLVSGRQRDAEGFLLRWDGQRDKRSTRGKDKDRKSGGSRVLGSGAQPSEHEKIMAQIYPQRRKPAVRNSGLAKLDDSEEFIKVEENESFDDQSPE